MTTVVVLGQETDGEAEAIKDQIMSDLEEIKKNINRHNKEYENIHKDYRSARNKSLLHKQSSLGDAMDNLDIIQEAADITCENHVEDCDNVENYYNQEVQDAITRTSEEFSKRTQLLAEEYLPKVRLMEAYLRSDLMGLEEATETIEDTKEEFPDVDDAYFKKCVSSIEIETARINSLLTEMHRFVGELQTVTYGMVCLSFKGVGIETLETDEELKTFKDLTQAAMELACTQQDVDADVVMVKVAKQEYGSDNDDRRRGRGLLSYLRKLLEDEDSIENMLDDEDDSVEIKIGTVMGYLCDCRDDEPLASMWNSDKSINEGDEGDRRMLKETTTATTQEDMQERYVLALRNAFKALDSPFGNVVEVEQFACSKDEFLMGNPLQYISFYD